MKNNQKDFSRFYQFHGRNDINQSGESEHNHSFPKMKQSDKLQIEQGFFSKENDPNHSKTLTTSQDHNKAQPMLFPPPKVRDHAITTNKIKNNDHQHNPPIFAEADEEEIDLLNEEHLLEQNKRISNLVNDFHSLFEVSSPTLEDDESFEEETNLNLERLSTIEGLFENELISKESYVHMEPPSRNTSGEERNPLPSKAELLKEFSSMLEDEDSMWTMSDLFPADSHPGTDEIEPPFENKDIPEVQKDNLHVEKYPDEQVDLKDEIASLLNPYDLKEESKGHSEKESESKNDDQEMVQSEDPPFDKNESLFKEDSLNEGKEEDTESKLKNDLDEVEDSLFEESKEKGTNSEGHFNFLSDFYEEEEDDSENIDYIFDEDNTLEPSDDSIMDELQQYSEHEEIDKGNYSPDQDLENSDYDSVADLSSEMESEGYGDPDSEYSSSVDEFSNLLKENFCDKEEPIETELNDESLKHSLHDSCDDFPSFEEKIEEARLEEINKCESSGILHSAKLPVFLSTTNVEFTFSDSFDLLWPVAEILETKWSLFSLETKVLVPCSHVFIKALFIVEIEYTCEDLVNTIHSIKVPINLEKFENIIWDTPPELPIEYNNEYIFKTPGENDISLHHETYKSTAEPLCHCQRNFHIIAHNEVNSNLESPTIHFHGTANISIDFYQQQYVQIIGCNSTD